MFPYSDFMSRNSFIQAVHLDVSVIVQHTQVSCSDDFMWFLTHAVSVARCWVQPQTQRLNELLGL